MKNTTLLSRCDYAGTGEGIDPRYADFWNVDIFCSTKMQSKLVSGWNWKGG
jgi:hypothetical protein